MSSETLRPHASQSDDEAAVRALYTQAMEGWNTGSGESFAAPFAQSGKCLAQRHRGSRNALSFSYHLREETQP
jgi:uncharacterized protein (TIGR02246 family)